MTDVAETIATLGEARMIPLARLQLDGDNPRLPETLRGQSQADLAVDMALGFDAITVAESIASHGYFTSEPLIAIPSGTDQGIFVVVEGNRRLTALLGLTSVDIRSEFADSDEWDVLARAAAIPADIAVPVVVAPNRRSVTPIIGFRHISGILAWQPYAQARYVAKLVDDDSMSFSDVAKTIGIEKTKAANLYRDQAIAVQAREQGLDTGNLERSFSLLTVAMTSPKLRDHVGAPLGSQTVPGTDPIPAGKHAELKEALVWVFGDETRQPVISDSREIPKLGNVIASAVGLKALRDGETLEQAIQRVKDADDDPESRLIRRLRTGKNSLNAALDDITDYSQNEAVRELVDGVVAVVDALEAAVDDTAYTNADVQP